MSITTEITRITEDRNTIRNKLVNLGLVQSADTLDDLADAVDGIANRGAPTAEVKEGEQYTIQPGYYSGGSVAGVAGGEEADMYAGADEPSGAVHGDLWVDTSDETITVEALTLTQNGTTTAPAGKAYSSVTVNVPTGTQRSASDVTVSGATVSVPAGLYSIDVSKSVVSGSAGTPTASKGIVSNHSITVTPQVTNTTGYITGGTKTGAGVSVSASELVSGNETKTANGTYDVTNLASIVVNVPDVSKNVQAYTTPVSSTSTTMTNTNMKITVSKTGTYTIYLTVGCNRNSGAYYYRLQKGSTYLVSSTTISTTTGVCKVLTDQSLTQGNVLTVGLQSASTSYRAYATSLIIVEQ